MKKAIGKLIMTAPFLFSAFTAQALEVGQEAPLFTADSTQGRIDLAEVLKEKPVILAFYYADFTPV